MRTRPDLPRGPFLVVGLARSGIAGALALRARGADVIGVDASAPAGAQALIGAGVALHLHEDGVALLERVHTVVKSPGVPADAPVVLSAHERGLTVLGELELAWRMLENEFIAVTGTNGKTTTVELVGHIHRRAGVPVAVAGNVGTALSGLVERIDERTTVVCEVSSFQLEDTIAFAPDAAVLLNLTPDHLDRHGTIEAYLAAKLQIFARQRDDDLAVTPTTLSKGGAPLQLDDVGGRARRVRFGAWPEADLYEQRGELWWQGQPLVAVGELRLRGRHNIENAMAAAAVCLARGIDPDAVRTGLRSFPGVAHRLEEVASRDGVLYVNDSKATNVASTLVAIEAFAAEGEMPSGDRGQVTLDPGKDNAARAGIHLILGGLAKDQDFTALRDPVAASCRAVYVIGQDAPRIAGAFAKTSVAVHESGELERAVAQAGAAAGPGEVILLSPGCASFDQFADFEARGERFRELAQGR